MVIKRFLDMLQNQVPGTGKGGYRSVSRILLPVLYVSFAFLIYASVNYSIDRNELRRYHQDCGAASSTYPQVVSSQACVYKPGTVSLQTNYNVRGRRDSQDAEIIYPDSTTASMSIDSMDHKIDYFSDINRRQVDGPCWVELWHGKITAVTNAKHRFVSVDNLEDRTAGVSSFLFLYLSVLIICCVYLIVKSIRDKARQQA